MSSTGALVDSRGEHRELEAYVVGAAWCGPTVAFALGDGTVRMGGWQTIDAHDGAVLALAATSDGFVTGGDDGALQRINLDGACSQIAKFGSKWVEQVAACGSVVACGVGKTAHVFDGGAKLKTLEHPSTVTGIAFDARGKRIAASHYDGASVWYVAAKVDTPRRLEWKGSHTGIAVHPAGDAVVTAMQENSLHGWRLEDGQHMRMSGYPSKTESLGFTHNGRWLASSGADTVVMWPFFGGGPMGKAPTELAGGHEVICTRVACHPKMDMVAAGFANGMAVLADIATARLLPLAAPGHGSVSALAWSPDGSRLALGTETGFAAIIDLSQR